MKIRVRSNKISDIFAFAHSELGNNYPQKEIDAMMYCLFALFCSLSKAQVLMDKEQTVLESQLISLMSAIGKLKRFVPLQYITKNTEFYSLNILLNHHVLIPRPETEELVDIVIKENQEKEDLRVCDLCCGSGCIALALKKNLKNATLWAFDLSDEAIAQTKENAKALECEINVVRADVLQESFTDMQFDLIVSNPPYVMEEEKEQMKRNVLDYEPQKAIFAPQNDPLVFYKAVNSFLHSNLKEGGVCYLEINPLLSSQTLALFSDFIAEEIKDFSLKERFIKIQKH